MGDRAAAAVRHGRYWDRGGGTPKNTRPSSIQYPLANLHVNFKTTLCGDHLRFAVWLFEKHAFRDPIGNILIPGPIGGMFLSNAVGGVPD
jgi:hypothetical protein